MVLIDKFITQRVCACFFGLFFTSTVIYSSSLNKELDSIITTALPHSSIGVLVKEIDSDKIIYARNHEKLLSPASSIKVFTAAASLYHLGADYYYETSLLKGHKDIYLRFTGDPSLDKTDVIHLIEQLKRSGLKNIEGNFIIDDTRFEPPNYAAGINYDDLGWYYVAPSSAIILNGNKEFFDFISAKKIGQPVKIKSKNSNSPITVINNLISASFEQKRNHCDFNIEIKPENSLRLYGCLPQYKAVRTLALAVPDPFLSAKRVIKEALQKNGIKLKGEIVRGKVPSNALLIANHKSSNLISLVNYMLKESDNLYADSITKLLGFSLTKQGTYKQGVFAMKKIIAKNTSVNVDNLDLSDGQGTRYNLVTPSQMVTLLTNLYNDKSMRSYIIDSLPVMGKSGSLRTRMKDTKLENRVYAKTGTMHDISSLSGYFVTTSGKHLAFSIIVNGMVENISKAKNMEDKILSVLAEHLTE